MNKKNSNKKENQNEKKQFELFKDFFNLSKNEPEDLFYGALKVEKLNDQKAYDAIVGFKNYKKHVQLTTMNTSVAGTQNKYYNASQFTSVLQKHIQNLMKNNLNSIEKAINKTISYFKKNNINLNIEYEKTYLENKEVFKFKCEIKLSSVLPGEIDLDKKYKVISSGWINAITRTINNKKKKLIYISKNKKEKSVLVILDESNNAFYRMYLNSNLSKNKEKEWESLDYFKMIFFAALKEIKDFKFFDEIQVYFKIWDQNNQKHFVLMVNNKMNNNFPIEEIRLPAQIVPLDTIKTLFVIPKNL